MKKLAIVFLFASSLAAQVQIGKNVQIGAGSAAGPFPGLNLQPKTVATLPPAAANLNVLYLIKDGTSSTDCTTGGGTTAVECISNGTVWAAFAGAGGGSVGTAGQLQMVGGTAGSFGASHVTDNGTTVSSSEPIAVAVSGGQGGTVDLTEGTAPSAVSGHDILYADSAAHCTKYSANGGSFACLGAGGGGGNTTSTSLTNNFLPKANGTNSIINSAVSDNGTSVTVAEPLVLSGSTNGELDLTFVGSPAPSPPANSIQFTIDGAVATPYKIPLPTSGPTGTLKYLNCAADPCVWDAGGGGGGGSPGGLNTQVQFNNSGSFGADANFIWDNTNKRLKVGPSSTYGCTDCTFFAASAGLHTAELHGTATTNNRAAFVLSGNLAGTSTNMYEFGSDGLNNGTFSFYLYDYATTNLPLFIDAGDATDTLGVNATSNKVIGFRSGTSNLSGSVDTAFSRDSAGVVDLGNGTASNKSGTLNLTNLNVTGTCTGCGGVSNFSGITGGTNTAAAMVVGAGASLNFTSTGTINASTLGGATFAAPGTIGGTTPGIATFTTLNPTLTNFKTNAVALGGGVRLYDDGSGMDNIQMQANAFQILMDDTSTTNMVLGYANYSRSSITPRLTINHAGDATAARMLVGQGTVSAGTTFTASGCTVTTLVGGSTAGSFHSGTTGTCTVTITVGTGAGAPNGFACFANDLTTPANQITQSGTSTTTAILTGTTTSGDVINFGCIGY